MIEITDPPAYRVSDYHLWADFVEILCALDRDEQLSMAQFTDWHRLAKEGVDNSLADDDDRSDDWMKESDKYDAKSGKIFEYFRFRSSFYGDKYPFIYKDETLRLKEGALSNNGHLLYLYLLCASHLSIFDQQQTQFTGEFELVSLLAVRNLTTSNAIFHGTGKAAIGPPEAAYRGNLFNKLQQIASDLGEKLTVEKDDFAATNTGDGGIDLLGWVPFSDKVKSRIMFAGQCKCSPEWYNYKPAGQRLKSYMTLNNDLNDLYFIPYCFRRADRRWHQNQHVNGLVVIDRSRIIHLLENQFDMLPGELESLQLVSELLQQKFSIS